MNNTSSVKLSMAELLAKQESKKHLSVHRGQEVEGIVVEILANEFILDLGTKAEGVLSKKDLPEEIAGTTKIGDKISAFVIYAENESGQVVLGLKNASRASSFTSKYQKFEQFKNKKEIIKAKGIEVNKGGLVVEVQGVRGFLPLSQVLLNHVSDLDSLVGKDIEVKVIEIDPAQNRLIFSQATKLADADKKVLEGIKSGDTVSGTIAEVMPFGVFIKLKVEKSPNIDGFAHISELSWDKVEDPTALYKSGDKVEAKVLSVDLDSGRVNLSLKQVSSDPFSEKIKELTPNTTIKATVTKVTQNGVVLELENGLEGIIPVNKMENEANYQPGQTITVLVDTVDASRRKVTLVPFITSTAGLIYK